MGLSGVGERREIEENRKLKSIKTMDSSNSIYSRAVSLVKYSRELIANEVDIIQLMTYYVLGKWIVEEQQGGENRAKYGKKVIEELSQKMNAEFGGGFSTSTLENCRKFYITYHDRISQPLVTEFESQKSQPLVGKLKEHMPFKLSWSHYLILMRIKDNSEREFYETEAYKEVWGKRELQRQYNSSLYERLALSKDKEGLLRMTSEGVIIEKPSDIIKQPTVLEFIGLEEKEHYVESDLENAILNKLQKFLLEMGKGYLFEKRQRRFTFDEDDYYVDLVLYNRLLKCYVLVDLKTDKLTHKDLGQMQMYVNYYDRYEKQEYENPTIGILLCKEKKDALIELTLPEDSNIYAAEYKLYLPDKKELQEKLREWIEELDDGTDIEEKDE